MKHYTLQGYWNAAIVIAALLVAIAVLDNCSNVENPPVPPAATPHQ
jgi:hypothetical protein